MLETFAQQRDAALGHWIENHTGKSSIAIFLHMTKGRTPRASEAPSDEYDRMRCVELLKARPEWIPRLEEIEMMILPINKIFLKRENKIIYPWKEQIPLIREML